MVYDALKVTVLSCFAVYSSYANAQTANGPDYYHRQCIKYTRVSGVDFILLDAAFVAFGIKPQTADGDIFLQYPSIASYNLGGPRPQAELWRLDIGSAKFATDLLDAKAAPLTGLNGLVRCNNVENMVLSKYKFTKCKSIWIVNNQKFDVMMQSGVKPNGEEEWTTILNCEIQSSNFGRCLISRETNGSVLGVQYLDKPCIVGAGYIYKLSLDASNAFLDDAIKGRVVDLLNIINNDLYAGRFQ